MSSQFFNEAPLDLDAFLKTELPPVSSWIGPGVLPKGGKLLFGGQAKIGKSFLGLNLARALLTGENPFNCPIFTVEEKDIRVQLIEAELGPWELQARAKGIFADVPEEARKRLTLYSQARGMDFSDPIHVDAIAKRCRDLGINVLIIDPIGKMHHYNENDNGEIARLFEKLEKIQDINKANGLSIVIAHHFGKPPREPKDDYDPFSPYNFRGASKWFDDPDTIVTVVRTPDIKVGRPGDPNPKGWVVRTKWETRRSAEVLPEGTSFTVHRNGDGRVLYEPEALLVDMTKPAKTEPDGPYRVGSGRGSW